MHTVLAYLIYTHMYVCIHVFMYACVYVCLLFITPPACVLCGRNCFVQQLIQFLLAFVDTHIYML